MARNTSARQQRQQLGLPPVPQTVRRPPKLAPWGNLFPAIKGTSGSTPAYPLLTEEVGYPPSPLANAGAITPAAATPGGRGAALGPVVVKALQDVLGWKIKADDPKGFVGALNQSFKLTVVEG